MFSEGSDPVEAVVFDVGNVLCHGGFKQRYTELSERYHVERLRLVEFARKHRVLADLGIWSEMDFWAEMYKAVGITDVPSDDLLEPMLELIEDSVQLAGRLHATGIRVAILTNDSHQLASARRQRIEARIRTPSPYVISAEERIAKPSPEIYTRVVNRLMVPPHRVLMIDDSRINILGAEEAGLQGVLFTGTTELALELRKRGVLGA